MSQYDKQFKGEQYTHHRAKNHIRQFGALSACYESLKKIPESPLINFRVRDDAFVMGINIDQLVSYLIPRKDFREAVFQKCASWDGMNDKIAVVSRAGAKSYFLSPLEQYSRVALSKWVHNPETYYMDTYMRDGFFLTSASSIQIVSSRPRQVSVKD